MSGGSGSGSGGGRRRGGSGSGSGSGSGGGGGGLGPLQIGPDGVVRGGNGSETIFPGYRDGDGDRVDSNDARLPGETGNDDIIYANGGNDNVNAGSGNDYADGGTGNDRVDGGAGNDVVIGNAGNDTLIGGLNNDTIIGGSHNDNIDGGHGNDVIYGDGQSGNTGNLITNGNFNAGGHAWQRIDGNNDGVTPHIGGDASFNNGGRAAGNDGIQQTFGTNIGAEHTVSMRLYENNSGNAHHGFRIDVLDQNGNVISSESVAVQNGTSQNVSFTFTATTANTTLRIINTKAVGEHHSSDGKVDDISVVETPVVAGNDTIDAGDGNDWVDAGGGNDNVQGGTGDDTVFGGDGNDTVDGGWGTDRMDGGAGIDTVSYQNAFGTASEFVHLDLQAGTGRLNGGPTVESVTNFENAIGSRGADSIAGTSGANRLEGGDGNDTLNGRGGNDTLIAGNNDDLVISGQGLDYQDGGAGNDTISFDGANGNGVTHIRYDMTTGRANLVNVHQVVGTETTINFENAIGSSGNDWFTGDNNANRLEGRYGNDVLQGGGGNDTILGEIGNDFLGGDAGNDSIEGGSGNDRIWGHNDHDVLKGGTGNDTLDGGSGNDTLEGGDQHDILTGGDGHDRIWGDNPTEGGADGNDTINAGTGNDSVQAGGGHDTVFGDQGNDVLVGGSGNDSIDGGWGLDNMDGGAGIDTVSYQRAFGSSSEFVNLDLQAGTGRLNGGPYVESVRNFENAIGSSGSDSIAGTTGANRLEGGDGNDTLDGRDGNDTLIAGNNDDLVISGQGLDYQDGGAGNDTISFDGANGNGISHIRYDMTQGQARLVNFNNVVVGTETTINFENAIGSSGNDWFTGDNTANRFEGRDGNDLIQGGGGNDTILGEIGNDVLLGDQGNDSIDGGIGHDRLIGGENDDTLLGGHGNDTLDGGNHNDSLDGGEGNDSLIGGSGDDTLYGGTGSDIIQGGTGQDTYQADTKVDEHIHATINDEGDGTVREIRGNTTDTVDDVEHYTADETNYDDRITLSTAVTDRSTITGISDDVTGTFSPLHGGPAISFGGNGEPKLSEILADPSMAGRVTITGGDESGKIGNISFENFEIIDFDIACFASDTRILTDQGYRAVQDLTAGDMVMTVDNGFQPIKWAGSRTIPAHGKFAPVRIAAGALGNTEDLFVSQQHRMLVSNASAALLFGEEEVLVPAKALVNDSTIRIVAGGEVTYHHLMFDRHQLVFANGCLSESFYPGEAAMSGVEADAQEEIFELFPELRREVHDYGELARTGLTVREGQLLL